MLGTQRNGFAVGDGTTAGRKLGQVRVSLSVPSAELREVPAGQLRFAPDSPLEGDGFEPSVPREGPTRRDGFIRISSGGSEAHHQGSAILTARSGRRSPPGP